MHPIPRILRTIIGPLVAIAVLMLAGCGALQLDLARGFAIVYGVAEYAAIGNLSYSDNDATDMYSLLTSDAQGFDPEDVILRVNADATKEQLETDFATIAARIRALPDPSLSRFVFYFAGHGYGDGMTDQYPLFPEPWRDYFSDPQYSNEPGGAGPYTEYLFLYNVSIDAPSTAAEVAAELAAEAESDDDLARQLGTIRSREKIAVIDACHSGGFIGDGGAVDAVPRGFAGDGTGISILDGFNAISLFTSSTTPEGADVGPDTLIVTAAGEQEFSYEYSPWMGIENGVFTHYFLEAPEMADANYDGFVTVTEAYNHAVRSIEAFEDPYLAGEDKFIPRLGNPTVDYVLFTVP